MYCTARCLYVASSVNSLWPLGHLGPIMVKTSIFSAQFLAQYTGQVEENVRSKIKMSSAVFLMTFSGHSVSFLNKIRLEDMLFCLLKSSNENQVITIIMSPEWVRY